jgi:CRP-like cAMP-binding protein
MQTFESHRALSLTDIMLFLKRFPLFSSMSLDQLRTIAAHMTEREMLRGEIIFHEGDHSLELYLIVSGKVDIVQHFGATPRTLVTLEAGGFLGDMAIFENRPRSADAVGAEPGLLLVLSPEHFRQIILQDPAISFEIFRELSARLRRFDEEAMEVTREA